MERREFLSRTCKASGLAAATAGAGWWLSRRSPAPQRVLTDLLRDFSVPSDDALPQMAIAKGSDSEALVRTAVDLMGGMERFVSKGDVVLIKPNAAFDRPPGFGATTSPEVVGAAVRLCVEAGATRVIVTDNPIHSFDRCFERSGIHKAVLSAGGELAVPTANSFSRVDLAGWVVEEFPFFAAPFQSATKLIGIPTAKDHNLCGASLSMKNWYGFLGQGRNRLHQQIHEAIADLAQAFKPTLVILDATRLLMRNGPTGGSSSDVVPGNVVCCSADQVAVDAFGAELLGKSRLCAFIQLAQERGIGTSDWRQLAPKEITL